ncbi:MULTISPECIES: CHASE2 domain-containing protein [unclassified Microcoleus]|uniref:CHASE2 domain-containing protein n=1 Tax=unclassified Microcoleus TaxID=2642155 RepID=UPI002FD2568C
MNTIRYRQAIGIGLVTAWSLFYCAVSSNLPMLNKMELDIQDHLIRMHKPGLMPKEILLLKIKQPAILGYNFHNLYKLNTFYAILVKSLINSGAKLVVINLPTQMSQYIELDTDPQLEHPFQELISKYSNQIVLVARPSNLPSENSVINDYHNLLPFDKESINPSIPPEQIVSYFRYAAHPQSLDSPARKAELFSNFSYEDDPDINIHHKVKSVATMALEKFYINSGNLKGFQDLTNLQTLLSFQMNFWGPADTFPSIDIHFQCPSSQLEIEHCNPSFDPQSLQKIHDKLVLIDLPEGKGFETYRQLSPFGEMSVAEVEANQIASLMTHSFLTRIPNWYDYIITTLGLGFITLYILSPGKKHKLIPVHLLVGWLLPILVGSYVALSFILFYQGLILPLSIPILGWVGTGSGVAIYSILRQSIQQQQKLAERQAVLLQSRKLLHRVATDIHDGPLQELKLAMDSIELLALSHPSPLMNSILDRLEAVGLALRNQLSSTRTIAEKLEITPELQYGLDRGIHQWLQKLINSRELTLSVKEHLQPLREPKSDSAWIDSREDIFRFFREAIANVIRHAQPPNGSATQVSVSLTQKDHQCRLAIENNGTSLTPILLDITHKKRRSGGYGTKLMKTIAAEIPNGAWQRISLEEGGMRVTLEWTMDTP